MNKLKIKIVIENSANFYKNFLINFIDLKAILKFHKPKWTIFFIFSTFFHYRKSYLGISLVKKKSDEVMKNVKYF